MIPDIRAIPVEFKGGLFFKGSYYNIQVPERFSKRIIRHVVSNYVIEEPSCKPPLYLAIQGEPGEGKTTQALAACTQKGILVKYLSSSELSGEMESESKEKLKEIYDQTQRMKRNGFIVCILLDDFHLGNSNISKSEGRTVNAELLVSYMMNLVDVDENHRVPILLTGNDFSGTYKALLRDGRADIFNWAPNSEERIQIVTNLLSSACNSLTKTDIIEFVNLYSDQSIAFFSQLKNDLNRVKLDCILDKYDEINIETIGMIKNELKITSNLIEKEMLYKVAEDRLSSRKEGGL